MSESTQQPVPEQKQTQPEPAAAPAATADGGAAAQPIVIQQKGGGKGLAAGALVLSLIALGVGGFLFVEGQNVLRNQETRVSHELDKAALGESQNGVLLQESLREQQALKAKIQELEAQQAQGGRELANVDRAYTELLKGRVNWLVDEVEVTLNLASQQLVLSGNVPVAVNVLESLEQRLSRFEQPELLPIKQAISQDLAALKNRPYLNVAGTALRLDRLENGAAGLPLLLDSTLKTQNAPAAQVHSGGFWSRTWENSVNMLKGMVEVRHLDSNDAMLLAPEQVYFVRENLRLNLLDARLALLQHNGEVYQNDLNKVETTVKQYFDVQSPTTQAWLKELDELKALEVRMVSDDALKASQAAVRNYQNSVRTAMPVVLPENAPLPPASAPASADSVQAASAAPAASAVKASEPAAASKPAAKDESKGGQPEKPQAKPETKPDAKAKGAQA